MVFSAGAGAVGVAGAGVAGAGLEDAGADGAGAVAPAGSRMTEVLRSPPISASENDVIVNRTAIAPVILLSTVGVPMEPNTAWLPAPPNADPMELVGRRVGS